jgi:hypothetical protein
MVANRGVVLRQAQDLTPGYGTSTPPGSAGGVLTAENAKNSKGAEMIASKRIRVFIAAMSWWDCCFRFPPCVH